MQFCVLRNSCDNLSFLVSISLRKIEPFLFRDGQKMSKRKKNYPDPMDIVAKYGADSIR